VNVNKKSAVWHALVFGVLTLGASGTATATATAQTQTSSRDWADRLATPFVDPLLTRPPLLDTGNVLPGDTAALPCSGADQPLPQPLTLGAAVDVALCHNPRLQRTWSTIRQHAAQLGEARAAYLPTLQLGVTRQSDRTSAQANTWSRPSERTYTSEFATLTWRLLDFGGRNASHRAAEALLAAALSGHDAETQNALTDVVAAFFEAQTAFATQQAKHAAQTVAQQTLETARRRAARGSIAPSDVLQAVTAAARAELDSSRAQGNYDKSLRTLRYAMGLTDQPTQTLDITLSEPAPAPAAALEHDLSTWLEWAETQHPALHAARQQLAAAREQATAARSEGLPTLDFKLQSNRNSGSNSFSYQSPAYTGSAALTLTIPLFDGFSRTYKVRAAQARIGTALADLEDAGHRIQRAVGNAYADAHTSLRNLSAAQRLEDAARNAVDAAQRKFERGAADVLERLQVQDLLTEAQLERIRAQAEWRSARLRLVSNAGTLGRDAIQRDSLLPEMPGMPH